jgi:transcriptional regulator GlxA family with amidase domain
MAMASFMALVGYLSRCYNNSPGADSAALLRIGRTISHLEMHFGEPDINVEALADMAHMSKRSFMRTFQAATGLSPIAYLIQLRINRAAQLLRRRPELSITEVALQSGFSDSNYFTRQFRLQRNQTPSEYRRQKTFVAEAMKAASRASLISTDRNH